MPSIQETLSERGARYGKFEDHARICQGIKASMTCHPGWNKLAPDQKQALETIADKVARMLNGDPDYDDNWRDIAGYATLVLDRLTAQSPVPEPRPVKGVVPPRVDPGKLVWK